ncbi:hypothetical protein HID58_006120 [Brassica napus]|uniref:Uncharacterized protein n=1 Tax=Brassica napus TaxID=3708 RepID=A0ABQ8EAH5_BRANA|nr:hypothetical protein HID58_006120 [Brassica napus]
MRVLIFQGVGEAIKSLPLRFANRLLLLHRLGTVAAFLEARNVRCAYSQEQGLVADDEQESPECKNIDKALILALLKSADASIAFCSIVNPGEILKNKAMMVMEGSVVACKCLGK